MLTRRSILGLSLGAAIGCLIPTRDRWRKLLGRTTERKRRCDRVITMMAGDGLCVDSDTEYVECTFHANAIYSENCSFIRCRFILERNGIMLGSGKDVRVEECDVTILNPIPGASGIAAAGVQGFVSEGNSIHFPDGFLPDEFLGWDDRGNYTSTFKEGFHGWNLV